MSQGKAEYESVDGFDNVVRISPIHTNDPHQLLETTLSSLESCFKAGKTQIIVDLKDIQFPTASFIALLIEATSRARRLNGDIKIINLSQTAKSNLVTFSPTSYLTIETDEKYALDDFQEAVKPPDEKLMPKKDHQAVKDEDPPFRQEKQAKSPPPVDIVENPLIEQLESSLQVSETPPEPLEERIVLEEAQSKDKLIETSDTPETYLEKKRLRVKSIAKNLYAICDFVTDCAKRAGFTNKEVGKTKIAVYEASLNIVEHAYHSNPDNWIDSWVEFDGEKLIIELQDYGHGFEGFSNKRYDVMKAMEKEKTGGFGLYIIMRSMDEVEYQPNKETGNKLTLIKYLN